jgi:predicted Zn-dependent peptidase
MRFAVAASLMCGALAFNLASAVAPVAPAASPQKADMIDIPFEKFQLDNGLTVVVHEDHKAPIVAVSVWYHVGSADEPAGKTGFAHLFEHLMFSGSENHKARISSRSNWPARPT